MHQNISLRSNGVDRVRSLWKIPTRLRGTNFCTSSARFAPSFVRQPNGPECTQIVRNASKRQFRVQWGGSGAFVAKNTDATSFHELLHLFGPFCIEFRKATKQSRMHPYSTNRPKCQFRGTWGGSGAFVPKNSDATSWHELSHLFGPFCMEFCKATKQSRMHPNSTNAPKCQYRVTWGGSGAFVAKKSDATSWHELLH